MPTYSPTLAEETIGAELDESTADAAVARERFTLEAAAHAETDPRATAALQSALT